MHESELAKPLNEVEINAKLEILQGYFNRIGFQRIFPPNSITVDDILDMLQCDIDYLRTELVILDGLKIINGG